MNKKETELTANTSSNLKDKHTHKKVLLVEDNMISAIRVINMLKKEGYETFHTGKGETAVWLIENGSRFDFILMDVSLEDNVTGTEAAKRILKICRVPVIFLTGYSREEIEAEMGSVSYYGYISKLECCMEQINEMFEKLTRSVFNSSIMKRIIASSDRSAVQEGGL